VYAGYNQVGSNAGGLNKALRKIRKATKKGNRALRLKIGTGVAAKWAMTALKKVQELKIDCLYIHSLPDLIIDSSISDLLRRYPLGLIHWDMLNAVEVWILLDPASEFQQVAPFLSLCARVRLSRIRLGLSPKRMLAPIEHRHIVGRHGNDWDEAATQSAVLAGLRWLAAHQNANGLWSCVSFGKKCSKGKCTGPGSTSEYDAGVTGLALLAFLGASHTHLQGDFMKTVRAGLSALLVRQGVEGCIGAGKDWGDGHWIYNHCLATKAVCEALAWNRKNEILRKRAQKAVDFLVRCRNPDLGWRYGIKPGKNDTSCTTQAVSALLSARRSGLTVPEEAFAGALRWIAKVTDKTYAKTGYTTKGDSGARLAEAKSFAPGEAMSAAAVVTRLSLQGRPGDARDVNTKAGELIVQSPPIWRPDAIDLYYWYWGTQATFKLGGKFWKAWSGALLRALLPNQKKDGCPAGSWDPVGAWGKGGGRVYSTAIALLMLEVFFW
jgi:hypothetical protein